MGRLAWSQLRFQRTRAIALLIGLLLATTAFTVLTAASRTAQLRTTGTVSAHFAAAYDILVRPASSRTKLETQTGRISQPPSYEYVTPNPLRSSNSSAATSELLPGGRPATRHPLPHRRSRHHRQRPGHHHLRATTRTRTTPPTRRPPPRRGVASAGSASVLRQKVADDDRDRVARAGTGMDRGRRG
jgi:hypothetical protein